MLDAQSSTSWIINIAEASPLQTHMTENTTHNSIYVAFEVTKPPHQIEFQGTNVIPEFPPATILSLFTLTALITIVLLKKKRK